MAVRGLIAWRWALVGLLVFGLTVAETSPQAWAVDRAADHAQPHDPGTLRSAMIVCPRSFRKTLQTYLDYRSNQGIAIRVIDSHPTAAEVLSQIRKHSQSSALPKAVLIIGDAPTIGTGADANRQVPMHYLPTTVTAKFGSTPTMASDYPYADTDGDGKSDAAVGRIPVDTPAQLAAFIERIKGYESNRDFSTWRRRVNLVGGVGGFGMMADATIESVTRMMITASLPLSVRTHVAYGSPGHLFYPRQRFTDSVVQRYQNGARFWVYAGHGMVTKLDNVPSGPSGIAVLDRQSINRLKCDPAKAPIAMLLCCFTGAIDAPEDSFSERMLLHDCGPIAVIAGNRVTMPYGNASLTLGLIDSVYGQARSRDSQEKHAPASQLGQAWLAATKELEAPPNKQQSQLRNMIDAIATLVSPAGTQLADERAEHAALYSLLGDPLLRLQPPQRIEVKTTAGHDHLAPVTFTVRSPISGRCTVSVDRPLGERQPNIPGQPWSDPNKLTLVSDETQLIAGQATEFQLSVPAGRVGAVSIRVHVAGTDAWASGAASTSIRPAN